jgi:signal transduction histidine kinase
VRLWPRSLAGRLAALLVLTLLVSQVVSFALFAGERMMAFHRSYLDDLTSRLGSLVRLLEETPPSLHDRLVATMGSPMLRLELGPEAQVAADVAPDLRLRSELAAALGKRPEDIRLSRPERGWRGRERRHGRPSRGRPWGTLSVRLADGRWLNASVDRPPVPPLGAAFLASFLMSALAVGAVGALGVRRASRPLRRLAEAADRLGRGEAFEPLPETGPQETRQANIAFNRMRERLDRFIRDRTAMLAAVAHDLRTPITSLRLRAEFVDDEETRTKIIETLAEMQVMADSMLAFARGDAESEPTRLTQLSALVESVVEDAVASGRDVRFVETGPITLPCRPHALRRALANLVDNAVHYGARAVLSVERDAGEIRILVDDEGPGIPEAELERVFDPFVRLEASRSRETGGAGLGLSIARTILRSHGGDLRLENRREGGLRAIAALPRGA